MTRMSQADSHGMGEGSAEATTAVQGQEAETSRHVVDESRLSVEFAGDQGSNANSEVDGKDAEIPERETASLVLSGTGDDENLLLDITNELEERSAVTHHESDVAPRPWTPSNRGGTTLFGTNPGLAQAGPGGVLTPDVTSIEIAEVTRGVMEQKNVIGERPRDASPARPSGPRNYGAYVDTNPYIGRIHSSTNVTYRSKTRGYADRSVDLSNWAEEGPLHMVKRETLSDRGFSKTQADYVLRRQQDMDRLLQERNSLHKKEKLALGRELAIEKAKLEEAQGENSTQVVAMESLEDRISEQSTQRTLHERNNSRLRGHNEEMRGSLQVFRQENERLRDEKLADQDIIESLRVSNEQKDEKYNTRFGREHRDGSETAEARLQSLREQKVVIESLTKKLELCALDKAATQAAREADLRVLRNEVVDRDAIIKAMQENFSSFESRANQAEQRVHTFKAMYDERVRHCPADTCVPVRDYDLLAEALQEMGQQLKEELAVRKTREREDLDSQQGDPNKTVPLTPRTRRRREERSDSEASSVPSLSSTGDGGKGKPHSKRRSVDPKQRETRPGGRKPSRTKSPVTSEDVTPDEECYDRRKDDRGTDSDRKQQLLRELQTLKRHKKKKTKRRRHRDTSSSSTGVSDASEDKGRRRRKFKSDLNALAPYVGDTEWTHWHNSFLDHMKEKRIPKEAWGRHIRSYITGNALKVMQANVPQGTRLSYKDIAQRMKARYTSEQTIECYIHKFEMYKQKSKQSCQEYVDALGDLAMLAYGDRDTMHRYQYVRAQVMRWGKTKSIRDAAALHTGLHGTLDDLVTVCSRRENLEARGESDVVSKSSVKNVAAAETTDKPRSSTKHRQKEEDSFEKRMEKRFNVLTDTINQMKGATKKTQYGSPRAPTDSDSYSGGYTGVTRPQGPPRACKTCGEWHWDNECPRRYDRGGGYQGYSGPYTQDGRGYDGYGARGSWGDGVYRRGRGRGYRGGGAKKNPDTPNPKQQQIEDKVKDSDAGQGN